MTIIPFLSLLLVLPSQELPDPVDSCLVQALDTLELEPAQMDFDRDWASGVLFADSTVVYALQHILAAPGILCNFQAEAKMLLEIEAPPHFRKIENLISLLTVADSTYALSISAVPEDKLDTLLALAAIMWADSDEPGSSGEWGNLQRSRGLFVPEEFEFDSDSVCSLLKLWNSPPVIPVESFVSTVLGFEREDLQGLGEQFVQGVEGPVISADSTGQIPWVLAGSGRNIYREDCPYLLIIDTGGNDRYLDGIGGVVGVSGRRVSLIVDFEGDDSYESSAVPVSQGGALMGFAGIIDLEGNDLYRAGAISQGAGMFGQGFLVDLEGNDFYCADFFSQGSGSLGDGLLIDFEGDDSYRVSCFGQGFGGPGGLGRLVDGEGHDSYLAGFLYPHEPLLPDDHRAMSQGFAMGLRPLVAGGIGFLADFGEGNDTYHTEVFGQGAAYFYGLGMLLDESGQDIYEAAQYSQGSGIHLAAGYLWDGEGDDSYHSRFGPAQGSAHDLSVGFLFDADGNDYYTADGSQGLALNNSAALFIDLAGRDTYLSQNPNYGQGSIRWCRGSAGVGVFLDLADDDRYGGGSGADSTRWINNLYGVGLDVARITPDEVITPDDIGYPETLDLDSLFSVAGEWGVNENRERVLAHRQELASRGAVAVDYVLENHLNSISGLELRAIKTVVKENLEYSLESLLDLIRSLEGRRLRNAIYLLGEMGDAGASEPLVQMLENSDTLSVSLSLIGSLGEIGDTCAVAVLHSFAGDSSERVRRATAVALGKIADSTSILVLEQLRGDWYLDVRSAAEEALRQFEEDEEEEEE